MAPHEMPSSPIPPLPIRIYWEDTDAGGIVYYANYLKFAERARTEALRALGIDQRYLKEKHNVLIVVRHCAVDYFRPARLDDLLNVETQLQELGKVRMTMRQRIRRDQEILAEVTVLLACINDTGQPVAWPDFLKTSLQSLI